MDPDVSATDLRGIGELTTLTFLCQASALLGSSLVILLRAIVLSASLCLRYSLLELKRRVSRANRIPGSSSGVPLVSSSDRSSPDRHHLKNPDEASRKVPLSSLEIYEGILEHSRTEPVGHRFKYPVRMAMINLDRPPQWYLQAMSSGHLTADKARELAGTNGPVFLLTNPASLGYEQNPISVYYCYSKEGPAKEAPKDEGSGPDELEENPGAEDLGLPAEGSLSVCLAEVTNTPWGDRVLFTLTPGKDIVAKPMHVSPFMDMGSDWRVTSPEPGASLSLTFHLSHPKHGQFFLAHLRMQNCTQRVLGRRDEQGRGGAVEEELRDVKAQWFFWLMPHRVAVWIYVQALKLWWKGVPLFTHPKYTADKDYRLEPMERDGKRGVSCILSVNRRRVRDLGSGASEKREQQREQIGVRFCAWTDSTDWPWGRH